MVLESRILTRLPPVAYAGLLLAYGSDDDADGEKPEEQQTVTIPAHGAQDAQVAALAQPFVRPAQDSDGKRRFRVPRKRRRREHSIKPIRPSLPKEPTLLAKVGPFPLQPSDVLIHKERTSYWIRMFNGSARYSWSA